MQDRLPDNLKTLYEAFSPEVIDSLDTGVETEFDGIVFVSGYRPDSTAKRFYIVKSPEFVAHFIDFGRRFEGARIVELGIAEGGSTALLALVARPKRLLAFDIEPVPLDALAEFISDRGLEDVVRPFYGVDQADRGALEEILEREGGDEPLDLVIDDASHDLALTRTSFEILFPRLRPGGSYAIEDWNREEIWRAAIRSALRNPTAPQHFEAVRQIAEAIRSGASPTEPIDNGQPLSRLAVELLLACASSPDAVASVTVNAEWVLVERGERELDPADFSLADLYHDGFDRLRPPT